MTDLPENPYLAAGTPLGDDYRTRLERMDLTGTPSAKSMAYFVRAQAEQLYVHDPATTPMITWPQFNAFLRDVLTLCDLTHPPEEGNHA